MSTRLEYSRFENKKILQLSTPYPSMAVDFEHEPIRDISFSKFKF